jgi:hypothetical protein
MSINREQRRAADFDIKKYIKASNEIEGIYSEEEDAQSLLAWAYLEQLGDEFTLGDICRVQKIITLHQDDLEAKRKRVFPWHGWQQRQRICRRSQLHLIIHCARFDDWMDSRFARHVTAGVAHPI